MARPRKEEPQKIAPTVEMIPASAKPMVRPVQKAKDTVRVRYKPNGKIITMTAKQAQNTIRQSPKNYEIV